MASQVGVDDALLHQAREVSGPMSYRELVEPGLRALTYANPRRRRTSQPKRLRMNHMGTRCMQCSRPMLPTAIMLTCPGTGSRSWPLPKRAEHEPNPDA
jgi:hypothetical protein